MLADEFGCVQDCSRDSRWTTLLGSGCREGHELSNTWQAISKEAHDASHWLGEDLSGPLTWEAVEVGDGSTSGKTRSVVNEQLEQLRGKVLNKIISELPNRKAHQVLSWITRQ